MVELNDNNIEEIVKRAQDGDNEAFEQLFRRFGRPLYGTIARIIGDKDNAEELLQDVFLKIYRKFSSFNRGSSFYTWAYRIAVNMSLNYLKSKRAHRESQLEPAQLDAVPSSGGEDKDAVFRREATRAAIQEVPPRQRAVLVMRIYDGLDYASVARTLGCSEGAAKANFHFAMQKLRGYLKDYR